MDSSPGTGRPQRRGVHHSGSTPYIERPCLTIGLTVQPEVLQGFAGRPGFRGRGLLARFLYSLPESLVGRRQAGAPPVPQAVADRYALELHALAASLATPAGNEGPALLALDREAAELLLGFERDLEPRLAAGSGDLAHWPAGQPSSPAPPAAWPPSSTWPSISATAGPNPSAPHLRRRHPTGRLPHRARPSRVRSDGCRPPHRRRPLAPGLDRPDQPPPVQPPRRPPGRSPRPLRHDHRPRTSPAAARGARLPAPGRP